MTRIVDMRLILDRSDRIRVRVEGRVLGVTFDNARSALLAIAAAIPPCPDAEQLSALALEAPTIEPRERASADEAPTMLDALDTRIAELRRAERTARERGDVAAADEASDRWHRLEVARVQLSHGVDGAEDRARALLGEASSVRQGWPGPEGLAERFRLTR